MAPYILLLMLWAVGSDHPGTVTTAEFASKATCEAAAVAADRTFSGWKVKAYTVCSPK